MALRDTLDNFARDLHLPKPPFWMVALALIFVVLTWVPLALIARARVTPKTEPRIHLFQDMDAQPRMNAQDHTPLFADGRAMRPPVPGTVARGALNADERYERGFTLAAEEGATPQYVDRVPASVRIDEALLIRGQSQYNIYCAPCHGLAGEGDGPVHERAAALLRSGAGAMGTQWVQPTNLQVVDPESGQLTYGPGVYPDGKLFSVITSGIRNMPAYAQQIEVEDRWAIVAYVRALQVSQNAPLDLVPEEQRGALTGQP